MKIPPQFFRFFDSIIVQIAGLALAVFILVFFLFDKIIMPLYTRQGSERPIPELVGLTLEEATTTAESNGFTVIVEPAKYGEQVPEGNILEQNPVAQSLSKPGRKIHIVPARGLEFNQAPDLSALELRDAQVQCRNYGLVCGTTEIRYSFSDLVPKDYVISQKPEPGEEVIPGQAMQLVVSLGSEPSKFIVPSLVELSLHDARRALTEAGLGLGRVTRKETDVYVAGTVIAQSLRTGERVERGTQVDIVVAIPARMSESNRIDN
jgi:serine/threonine-protein kinase